MAKFNPDEWIGICRAGKYHWSAWAQKHMAVITEDDIRDMADGYDPKHYRAPLTIGHPGWFSPEDAAHGWISEVKAAGGVLYAKFKEMSEEILDMIEAGKYKARSIGMTPREYTETKLPVLHHVAILGTSNPAVAGLRPTFADHNPKSITLDYPENAESEALGTDNDTHSHQSTTDTKLKEDTNMSAEKIAELERQIKELSARPDITAAELAELRDKAAKADEYAKTVATQAAQLGELAKAKADADVEACFKGIPPSIATDQLKAMAHAIALKGDEAEWETFSAQYEELRKSFAKVLSEHAPEKPGDTKSETDLHENATEDSVDLDAKAKELMANDKNLSYRAAVSLAAKSGGDV